MDVKGVGYVSTRYKKNDYKMIKKRFLGFILIFVMTLDLVSPFLANTQPSSVSVSYSTHVQNVGWQETKADGAMAGTSGESLRLEGIKIQVSGNSNLGISYTTHVQDYGWMPNSGNGEMSGTEGESKRLEAIMIQLTGRDAYKYDVYYRVHAQNLGWMGWAKNGEAAGTAGYSFRLEGIQIVVVPKGESFDHNIAGISSVTDWAYISGSSDVPVMSDVNAPNVEYQTHVQNVGWQGYKNNGQMSGTSGLSCRLEGIRIKLTNSQYSGDIRYITHVQNVGWQGDRYNSDTWSKNNEMAGTEGLAYRLEGIQIELTGEIAEYYDVYYRVHVQNIGWMDWVKNGEMAGTEGQSLRLEGIEIKLVARDVLCDGEYITGVREETIVIPGVERDYQFLYVSDFHIIVPSDEIAETDVETVAGRYNAFGNSNGKKADEVFSKLVENVNKTNIDAVLMGGDMIDYLSKSNWQYLESELLSLNKPYLFATADHDVCTWWTTYSDAEAMIIKDEMQIELVNVLEYDQFIVMSVGENTSQLTEGALNKIQEVFNIGKPIIIVTHVPFESRVDSGLGEASKVAWQDRKLLWGQDCYYVPDQTTQTFIDMIYADDSPVVAVLTGHLHFEYICMLNENVKQYVFRPSYEGEVVLFTVTGESN